MKKLLLALGLAGFTLMLAAHPGAAQEGSSHRHGHHHHHRHN